MSNKSTLLKVIVTAVFCMLVVIFVHAKDFDKNDTMRLSEYLALANDEARIKWLYEYDLNTLNEFTKSNSNIYETLVNNVTAGNNALLKYKINFLNGLLKCEQSHSRAAVPLLIEVLNNTEFVTQSDSIEALIKLKLCFVRLLNYPKVFEMHEGLMSIVKRNPNIKVQNIGYPLSSIYLNLGMTHEAITHLKYEYLENSKIANQYTEANYYNNLGVIWLKDNKPDSAIHYFTQAQGIVIRYLKDDPQNKYLIFFDGLLSGNIGQALQTKGLFKSAIPLLKKDIICSKATGNIENAVISNNELALCYFELKQYEQAESNLDSVFQTLNKIEFPLEYLKALHLKAKIYAIQNNYKEAFALYNRYIIIKDSLTDSDKIQSVINQQIAYETNDLQEKIEFQARQIEARKQIEQRRIIQNTYMLILVVMLLLIIVAGLISYKKIKKREVELSEKNDEITTKSKLLEDTLKQKELLIKEVHHRVKNNMQIIISLLKLQADKIKDEQVEHYFSDARNRIQSMALIHEFLYKKEKMDYMQMDEYIIQLVDEIKTSYTKPDSQIELKTDCDPILLDFDTSIPLGLIVNELITNSFKHAFPNGVGKISITFKTHPSNYVLQVKDNGVGLPSNFESKKENSLGMELIVLLCGQIDAQLEINNKQGFEAIITIKKV